MNIVHLRKRQFQHTGTLLRLSLLAGLLLGACVLGYGIVTAAGGSALQTMTLGAMVLMVLAGVIAFVLEFPVIGLVRFAFIASFFFKGDLSLFKINEVEDPSGLNLSLTLATGLALLVYDHYFEKAQEKVLPATFTWLLIVLFTCAAASVIYSGPTLLGGFSLFSFLTSILIAYVTASHFGRRDRMIQLVVAVGAGLAITGIVALTQYAMEFPTNLPNFGTGTEEELLGTQSVVLARVPAFMRTPTEMAWVVSSLIPVVLAPLLCRVKSFTSWQKRLLAFAALSGTVAVILSLARGSWAGLIVAVALMISLGWYKLTSLERKQYFASVFASIMLAGFLLIPFARRISERLTADDQGSAEIRLPLMETALRIIDDNPIVGVGLNGYRASMTKYDETGIFVSQVFPNPVHNVFAHITAEVGIAGGVVFCLLILFSVYECFETMGATDRLLSSLALGLGVGMIAFVISGIKEPGSLASVRPPIRTCFFMFGMILALRRIRLGQIS